LDGAVFDGLVLAGGVREELGGGAGVGFGAGVDSHRDQTGERGIADFFASADLFSVEAFVVVLSGQAYCWVVGLIGLQDYLPGGVGAAGPARDLGEQLEGAFGGTKVWEGEALVGQRDADEGHAGDVVAFGDHLCADQHVNFASSQPVENRLDAVPRGCVAVEPSDARLGETLLDRLLELFGANPEPFVLGAPARRAGHGDRPVEITVVASQRALPSMFGKRDAAGGTLSHGAACRAAHAWGKATSVEEEDRLVAGVQAFAERGMKRPRKERVAGRSFSVAAEIDDLDIGHGGAGGARG
jgi:hypothetical protein